MSGESLFITGAAGFIGQGLLRLIDHTRYRRIYCLVRKEDDTAKLISLPPNCQPVIGDLNAPSTYSSFLADCKTVIHLAARTGKANQAEFYEDNAAATKTLLDQCQCHEIRNFLYISTIAVTYPETDRYYYALSKARGEDAVKQSRLKYAILRPTIVLGYGGQIWNSLYKMGQLPFLIIPGTGQVQIQPIYLDDLIARIQSLLMKDIFPNQIFELGGEEKVTFDTFFRRLSHRAHSRLPLIVHLPLKPLLTILSLLDRYAPDRLPVNSGQLSAFRFDSTADPDLSLPSADKMRSLNQTIDDLLEQEKKNSSRLRLEKECEALTFYLIRQSPNDYVRQKYLKAHEINPDLFSSNRGLVDRLQLAVFVRSPRAIKFADCYSSIFSRSCLLRKKTVLLLAILESNSSTYRHFDIPQSGGRAFLFGRMIMQGLVFTTTLAVSTFIFFPLTLIDRMSKERR